MYVSIVLCTPFGIGVEEFVDVTINDFYLKKTFFIVGDVSTAHGPLPLSLWPSVHFGRAQGVNWRTLSGLCHVGTISNGFQKSE